ncbi:MAG TPA: hypothetical protein ENN07_03965, partial [candidate division Zixibacteria bacterium]|nr:hypothetical protein [candidate division Zixibacteria bacterium]
MRSIIALFMILCCTAFSLVVDSSLPAKALSAGEGEFLPILIAVERPGRVEILATARQVPMSHRRNWATAELRKLSDEHQAPVLRELARMERAGDVRNIRPMWIGGSIALDVSATAFDRILQIPKIAVIADNSPAKLVQAAFESIRSERPFAPADAMAVTDAMNQVKAPQAWAMGIIGERVIVAVLDSGVRYTHNELVNRMWMNSGETPGNGSDDDMNGFVDDYHGYDFVNSNGDPWDDYGHGTNCAGLVAGDGSWEYSTGTAPGAQIMALKVVNHTGWGQPAHVSWAVQYAVDMGAHVLSISLGWSDPSDAIKNYFRVIFEDVLAAGVIAASSAGNGSGSGGHFPAPRDISAPADCPSPWQAGASSNTAIVAVGAMNIGATEIANFSSLGPTHWDTETYTDFPHPPGLMKPELTAPGTNVQTTSHFGDASYTSWFTGTSASCPIV